MVRDKSISVAFISAILLNGCSSYFVTSQVTQKIIETNVWVDYMPGSLPKTHATMRCTLTNTTDKPIKLQRPIGTIIDARSSTEFRRFNCQIVVTETPTRELTLEPNEPVTVVFRSPSTLVPFDVKIYDKVQMIVKCEADDEKIMVITSGVLTPIKTE